MKSLPSVSLLISLVLLLLCGFAPPVFAQDPPPEEPPAEQEPAAEEPQEEPEEEKKEKPAKEEPAEEEESPFLAIVGADVHTVTGGVIPGGTVLVEEDRITKIGTNLRIPDGAKIIDAAGMHVYPGLVAVKSSGLAFGGSKVADSFDPFSLNVDLALAGGLTTVETGGAVAKLTRGTLEGAVLSTESWVSLNYSTTQPRGRRTVRAELEKARDFLRKRGEYERLKARGDEDAKEPSDRGVKKDYVALLEGNRTARFNANSLKDLLAVTDLLEEYSMPAVIFGGMEAWTAASRIGRTGARLVITPRNKSYADDRLNRDSGWTIENAKVLHEAGVEFAIIPNQSFISTGGTAGRDLLTLPLEAAFAIRGGLPQAAALRAITIDAAKILGVADSVGSIEVGKDADLIICDGDLFDYRTFVQWAVVNGRIAYDKQKAPYFAHIRPRPEPAVEEVIEAIQEGAEAASESEVEAEEPEAVDAPEGE